MPSEDQWGTIVIQCCLFEGTLASEFRISDLWFLGVIDLHNTVPWLGYFYRIMSRKHSWEVFIDSSLADFWQFCYISPARVFLNSSVYNIAYTYIVNWVCKCREDNFRITRNFSKIIFSVRKASTSSRSSNASSRSSSTSKRVRLHVASNVGSKGRIEVG